MKKIYLLLFVSMFITLLFSQKCFAQNSTQLNLPEGAKARLGRGWIRDIEFSPLGDQLAVATTIGVWIYDARTGKEQALFSGVMKDAVALSYSPKEPKLAVAHRDHTIRLWDVINHNHKPISTFRGHTREIFTVTFSPDGTMIASGSADKTIRIWNPKATKDSDKLIAILPYSDHIISVSFSPDNLMLAGGCADGTIQVWNTGTGDLIYAFNEKHSGSISEIDFSPDGKTVISASLDGTVQFWSLVTPGGRLSKPLNHNSAVLAVDFSQDGHNFTTASADRHIRIWNSNTKELVNTLSGHKDIVASVKLSPDGINLASGSLDGTVRLWDARLGHQRLKLTGHTGGVKALVYTEDNRIRACGTGLDGKLRLWDAGTSSELSILQEHTGLTQSATFSKDGKILASGGSENGTIFRSIVLEVLKHSDESLLKALTGNLHGVTALAFSPANSILASGGSDGRIHLLDVGNGETLKILRGAQSTITSLTFVLDSTHLLSGEENGTVRTWDSLTGEEVGDGGVGSFSAITALAFSPNIRFLAIGDMTGAVSLYDYVNKQVNSVFTQHTHKITSLIFSEDDSTLVSGSEDGTILLWNMSELLQNKDEQKNSPGRVIIPKQTPSGQDNSKPEQSAQEIARKALASTVYLKLLNSKGDIVGYGSGFFVDIDKLVTNYHVVEGSTSILARQIGKDDWHLIEDTITTDQDHDLAILKLSSITTSSLDLANSDTVQTGETVYVVGNPKQLEGTFSKGIVSALRTHGKGKLIQIDAPISPGSSGGAVLNNRGEVIGIATSVHAGKNAQNLNFAVPSNYLKELLNKVK